VIFYSTFLYAFARRHGVRWHDELRREMQLGLESSIEALRTLASLMLLREEIATAVSAPMRLAAGRSDMAGRFLDTKADVWVSCDDDAEMRSVDLVRLVQAARTTRGIVSAPCLQRGDPAIAPTRERPGLLNIRFRPGEPGVEEHDGFALAPIYSTGFGLVAVHRDVVDGMRAAFPELDTFDEETERLIPALFFERLTGEAGKRRWQGEDMAFCARARDCGVTMHALLGVDVIHAKRRLRLEQDAEGFVCMRVFDVE
jgi:hypothetical protein